MSDKLSLRVIHPHYLEGVLHYPGDELELDRTEYEKAVSEQPFPYYHVLAGNPVETKAYKVPEPTPLPLDDTVPLAIEAMEIAAHAMKAEDAGLPLDEGTEDPDEDPKPAKKNKK